MSKAMDLQGNGRLDWFFNEWVYGTQVPRYKFEYQLSPAPGGKVKLHVTLTQSDVDEKFAMLVPLACFGVVAAFAARTPGGPAAEDVAEAFE